MDARIGLANILYNTSNWSEAIVHYRSAIRQDSSRATALVDLGVCYYNLGDAPDAERLFELALQRDPHQPVALFNLGIVSERRSDYAGAMKYFHRAGRLASSICSTPARSTIQTRWYAESVCR